MPDITIRATIWKGSGNRPQLGIRVGSANREHSPPRRQDGKPVPITVVIDGSSHTFHLTPGFWNKCPEFRERGPRVIRAWLESHGAGEWKKGRPATVEVTKAGDRYILGTPSRRT